MPGVKTVDQTAWASWTRRQRATPLRNFDFSTFELAALHQSSHPSAAAIRVTREKCTDQHSWVALRALLAIVPYILEVPPSHLNPAVDNPMLHG